MNHEHFKGKFEVELKYRIASKSEFLKVLESMEHEVMLQDNVESDWILTRSIMILNLKTKAFVFERWNPQALSCGL